MKSRKGRALALCISETAPCTSLPSARMSQPSAHACHSQAHMHVIAKRARHRQARMKHTSAHTHVTDKCTHARRSQVHTRTSQPSSHMANKRAWHRHACICTAQTILARHSQAYAHRQARTCTNVHSSCTSRLPPPPKLLESKK
jgi:hypothetical protein